MVCPLNAAFNRAAAYASLDQPRLMRPSHAVGSCFHPNQDIPVTASYLSTPQTERVWTQ
jgi:hypothetical protein